jgi:hypothetical protein
VGLSSDSASAFGTNRNDQPLSILNPKHSVLSDVD